ncbi:hypothetical protein [Flavobacterium sp.]|uniref:hypothetical protein n=1 Tax=Flavobacterium sp. TaxID=239 RepID=UPI00286F01A1|nr:hypothetical protein [Flavobacterium sp.]
MVNSKYKIGVVDKKGKYFFLFQGFRKNKFAVSGLETVVSMTSELITQYNLFFVVVYEYKDVFELLQLKDCGIPIIVASENFKIIKKLQIIDFHHCIGLSEKINILTSLHDCIDGILKK